VVPAKRGPPPPASSTLQKGLTIVFVLAAGNEVTGRLACTTAAASSAAQLENLPPVSEGFVRAPWLLTCKHLCHEMLFVSHWFVLILSLAAGKVLTCRQQQQ
jgi:hypothetical protein